MNKTLKIRRKDFKKKNKIQLTNPTNRKNTKNVRPRIVSQ